MVAAIGVFEFAQGIVVDSKKQRGIAVVGPQSQDASRGRARAGEAPREWIEENGGKRFEEEMWSSCKEIQWGFSREFCERIRAAVSGQPQMFAFSARSSASFFFRQECAEKACSPGLHGNR